MGYYLIHHGIKGQHWGDRNGPPYPLGFKAHSKEEIKKNPNKELDKYESPKERKTKNSYELSKDELDKIHKDLSGIDPYALEAFKRGLTSKEVKDEKLRREKLSKIMIGVGAVVGVGAAAYICYKYDVVELIKNNLTEQPDNPYKYFKDPSKDVIQQAFRQASEDMDYIMKKGTTFHRMHSYSGFDVSRTKGKLVYTSATEADRAAYMFWLKDWAQTGQRYDIALTAIKDIVAPSDKKARELFEEYYKKNPSYEKELYKTLVEAYKKFGYSDIQAKTVADSQIRTDKFGAGMYALVKGKNDSKMLAQMYRDAGYTAIMDYFDKGTLGEFPIILLDASSTVVKTGEKFVTRAMKSEALKILQSDRKLPMYKHSRGATV